jgi:hypothetical protein
MRGEEKLSPSLSMAVCVWVRRHLDRSVNSIHLLWDILVCNRETRVTVFSVAHYNYSHSISHHLVYSMKVQRLDEMRI